MPHHNPFFVLPDLNEVYKHIGYIIYDILVFFFERLYDVLCLMLSFRSCQVFHERITLQFFTLCIPGLGEAENIEVNFHTIIDECPQISFVYKESTVHFSEKNCDVTHHKSYGSELTAVIELRNHIVYILFSYTYGFTIYYVWCWASRSWNFPYSRKCPYPQFLQWFLYNLIPGLPYPGEFSCPRNFPYPVKTSMYKSNICLKTITIRSRNYQV